MIGKLNIEIPSIALRPTVLYCPQVNCKCILDGDRLEVEVIFQMLEARVRE